MERYYNIKVNHNYMSPFINGNRFARNSSLETEILKSDILKYLPINTHIVIKSIFQLPKDSVP